ncbi:hypothetical protein Tco_0898210 [Tanacetum coccineum]
MVISELKTNLKKWEIILSKNARSLTGNKDHPNACLCYMIYCLTIGKHFNLAYYIASKIVSVTKSADMTLPYRMLLTRLFEHVRVTHPYAVSDDHYLVDHVMISLSERRVFRIMPSEKRPRLPTPTPSESSKSTSSSTHQEEENDHVNNFTLDPIPYIDQLLPVEGVALVFSPSPSSPLEPHPYITTLDDLLPRNSNPLPLSLFQGHSQGLSQTLPIPTPLDFKPSFPPIKPSRNRMCAQPEPFLSRNQVIQQLRQFLDFDRHIKAAIQTAQNVQNNLLPSFTTTSPQMQPPFHFTTSSTTTIPPFRKSLPPSSTFVPLDQSLWMEGPPYSQPQEHTCPHCQ